MLLGTMDATDLQQFQDTMRRDEQDHKSMKMNPTGHSQPETCQLCGQKFPTKEIFYEHMVSHNFYVCKICSKTYSNSRDLDRHMTQHREQTRRFGCEVCGKRFTHGLSLKWHMNIHTGAKPYTCNVCGKQFAAKANVYQCKHKTLFESQMDN